MKQNLNELILKSCTNERMLDSIAVSILRRFSALPILLGESTSQEI